MPLSDACIQAQLLLEADIDPAPYFVIDVTAQHCVYANPAAAAQLFGQRGPETLSVSGVLDCLAQRLAPHPRDGLATLLHAGAGTRLRVCTLDTDGAEPGPGWDWTAILTGSGELARMHVRLSRTAVQPGSSGRTPGAAWRETAVALLTLGGDALRQELLGVDANASFCRLLPLTAGRKIHLPDWIAAGLSYFDLVGLMAAIDAGHPQERTLWLRPPHGLPQQLHLLVSPASDGAGGARSALLLVQVMDGVPSALQQAGEGLLQCDVGTGLTQAHARCAAILGRTARA